MFEVEEGVHFEWGGGGGCIVTCTNWGRVHFNWRGGSGVVWCTNHIAHAHR